MTVQLRTGRYGAATRHTRGDTGARHWYHADTLRLADLDWSWRERAACLGMDTELFFPVSDAPSGIADVVARVCATCPVIDECRAWARTVPERFGVWGGESATDRGYGQQRGNRKRRAAS